MMLPTLYKLTSTGATQFWTIGVSHEADASYLVTRFGQLDTDKPQETRDPIREGKNAGRSNATTREQQADAEAFAKWEKQKKKGYVESIEGAQAGEVDALIEGGVLPMLAHKYADQADKIILPCLGQPKLDGIRCMGMLVEGVASLWSRERRRFMAVPHVAEALEREFPGMTMTFDGELYNHELHDDFDKITSLIRGDTPDPRAAEIVQYHIYDVVSPDEYSERAEFLKKIVQERHPLVLVPSVELEDEDQIVEYFQKCRVLGYEGTILRNKAGRYLHKRSYDLQKVKSFEDGEFNIIGIKEGRGKLVGHAAVFVCLTAKGVQFEAKLKGSIERLRDHFDDHSLWQGKQLTVRHQGFTPKGSLRFPVGVAVRDYE